MAYLVFLRNGLPSGGTAAVVLYCQPVKTKYDIEGPRSGARPKYIHIVNIIIIHISKMWRWHISYF